jgi:hypothetical protein
VPDLYVIAGPKVKLRYTNPMVLERDFDTEGQIQEILDSLIALKNDSIIVERNLLGRPLCDNLRFKLGRASNRNEHLVLSVHDFLVNGFSRLFWDLGGRQFQYYIENDKLYICSSSTSKRRWIDWWKSQAATK